MKNYLNKLIKKVNNSAFDVAAAPMFIIGFGSIFLILIVAGGICFIAVKMIVKIAREKKAGKEE